MPVYFVTERKNAVIKIGVSTQIRKRLAQLQTANAYELELMGWVVSEDDYRTEKALHQKYESQRERGEWFSISQDDVLRELTLAHGFIPKIENAFEIIGYDQDRIPEYVGVCKWGDFEYYECCPFCGCFCGMHFNDALSMYHCINCDTLTDFSELSQSHE